MKFKLKIQEIKRIKEDIKAALIEKGVITSDVKFEDYASYIDNFSFSPCYRAENLLSITPVLIDTLDISIDTSGWELVSSVSSNS